jgi:predicted GIY-YIG superfamily endonuclease
MSDSDNVDRSLVEHWNGLRAENAEERRFLRLVETELRTSGSSAFALEEQVSRARRHVRARRSAVARLAPVIPLHAFE